MAELRSDETTQGPPESLFLQLFGGRSHIEGNVSKAFAMCFRESPIFAKAVLGLLHRICHIAGPRNGLQWHCDTEVAFAKGRPDIEIHANGVLFRLESKVGAPLTKEQLRRYRCRKHGHYLLAVTKDPPDVGRAWIKKRGAFSIRWQDVHRAVAGVHGTGRDRFLRDSFCLYLEELGMAHREDVRPADLQRLYELLETVAASNSRWRSVSPRNAFDVAESCLHLLREVARDAREEIPALQNWSRRGPLYAKTRDEDGDYWHNLGFYFRNKRNTDQLGAGFCFMQDESYARWEVWRFSKKAVNNRVAPFKSICEKTGALDRGKMLRSFVNGARALGVRG